jgi:hypothetical protein
MYISFNSPHAAEITSQVSYAPSFQAPFAGEEAPPERSLFGRGVRLGQMLARQHCTWRNKFTLLAWAAQYATAHRVSYFCGGDVVPENWTAGSRNAYPSGSSSVAVTADLLARGVASRSGNFFADKQQLTGNVRERHFPTVPCVAWGDLVADVRSRAGLVCFDARAPIFLFDASEHRSVGSLRFILVHTCTMSRVKSGCRPIGDRLAFQNCLHIEQ